MIALYKGTSLIPSKLIRWFTWSPYSHVSWICKDGSEYESWHKGGVVHNKYWGDKHEPGTEVDIFEFVQPLTADEIIKLEYFFETQLGKKYDWAGVFQMLPVFRLVGIGWNNLNKWFCSELFAAGCESITRCLLCKKAYQISPADVAASPLLTYVKTVKVESKLNGKIDTTKLPIAFA